MTNTEVYLKYLAGEYEGELPAPRPIRQEIYLAALCNVYTGDLPEPVTYADFLLKVLASTGLPGGGEDSEEFVITDASYLFYDAARSNIVDILLTKCKDLTNCAYMFSGYKPPDQTVIDVSTLDTSLVTDMSGMFYSTGGMTILGLENLNTSNVTTMSNMFGARQGVTASPDVKNFNTSKVTSMREMFAGTSFGGTFDLRHFDVGNVKDFYNMFYNSWVEEVLISGWAPKLSCSMNGMFYSCRALKRVDFSEVDTANITSMSQLFYSSNSLEEIIGFSATNKAGMSISFPYSTTTNRTALKRLTFRTDLPDGQYSIRSPILIKYCSIGRAEMVEMFNTLPDVSELGLTVAQTTITITGNPCVAGDQGQEQLSDSDKQIAIDKGWTIKI